MIMSGRSYRSTRAWQCLTAISLTIAINACGAKDEKVEYRSIERRPAPNSQFQAASLEDTLDTFAAELGQHEQQELSLRAVLPSMEGDWEPVSLGLRQAFDELAVIGEVVAPDGSAGDQAEQQAELVREQLGQEISGIGIAPTRTDGSIAIEDALDASVPTVTLDIDLANSTRDLFIGRTEYETGQAIGDTLLEVMPLREGTVILLGTEDEQRQGDYQRSMGAKQVIEETGLTVLIRNSEQGADGESADVESLKQDLLESQPLPLGMVGVLENSYRIGMAAQAADVVVAESQEGSPESPEMVDPDESEGEPTPPGLAHFGGVALVAYGTAPQTLEFMRARIIRATLAERRYYLGYLLPYVLYGFNVLGPERTRYILTPHLIDERRVHLGLDSVLAEELDEYLQFNQDLTAR